jgi:N-acetylmuramoyl-L-alanine amidase
MGSLRFTALVMIYLVCAGCRPHAPAGRVQDVTKAPTTAKTGDEIVVCGQRFHTGAPVVLWTDPGGYNGYQSRRRSATTEPALRKVYNIRSAPLTDAEVERVRAEGWTLDLLRQKVDQFVIHYDVAGTSRTCFKVLNDRGLGVQLMLDLDGTIYQTLDLQEQAPHATVANGRSVGIEIANMGAYATSEFAPLQEWYNKDADGHTRITLPARYGDGGIRTPNFVGHPARDEMVRGVLQGGTYRQYDFTPQQYESLTKLTAALCTVFPKIQCDYPRQKAMLGPPATAPMTGPAGSPATLPSALAARGEPGPLIPHTLTPEQFENYQGVLGHYHVQTDKQDPGPAFQWDRVINGARDLMTPEALAANDAARGQPARYVPSDNKRQYRRRASTRQSSTRPTTMPLHIVSFNVRNSNAMDGANAWPLRRELFFQTIQNYDPDLLGLQEVLPDQAREIKEHFAGTHEYLGVGRNDGKEKGEAASVLFRRDRFEKGKEGHFWLSPTPDVAGSKGWDADLTRIVTWVELRDRRADNRQLFFFNTHWDHKGPNARLESASLMRQRIHEIAGYEATIVTGDFNAADSSAPYNRMLGYDGASAPELRLIDSYRVIHPTPSREDFTPHPFTGKNDHPIRIDWILYTPHFRTEAAGIDHTNDHGRYPSDHFPVTATLIWAAVGF